MSYSPTPGKHIVTDAKYQPSHIDDDEFPVYQTPESSGMDLRADLPEKKTIQPNDTLLVPTGLHLDMPVGIEAQVRPRSGLAFNYGITVLNGPGTIDADYHGDIGVILINHSANAFNLHPGERIAQLVFAPVLKASFHFVDEFSSDSERGEGGFGSTGLG